MQVSQKTQKIVAIVCGTLLLCVIALILLNNPNPHKSNEESTSKTQIDSVASTEKPLSDTVERQNEEAQPKVQDEAKNEAKTDTNTHSTKDQTNEQSYVFTAMPGDSFTALAYNAISEYATTNKINLTDAQRTQAAATLAANAGSPLLEIGELVTIEKSDVASLIKPQTPTAPQSQESNPTAPVDKNQSLKDVSNYTYTAASGDSYVTLARRAVSDHVTSANLNLTPAQRIAAETSIAAAANFPGIKVGQAVTFTHASIKDAVEAAQKLTADQLSNWQIYANSVNF